MKVEKNQTNVATKSKDHNSTSSEKEQSRNGLLDENQQLENQNEVAIEKTLHKKEEVRAYQPPIPFSQRLK